MRKLTTAVLSVSDKRGIVELARGLSRHGVRLLSTGGTRRVLLEAGLEVTELSEFTGNPEAFGGRMKTLSFRFESALLFHRERDAAEARELGIEPIDLVVCNLYPFREVRDRGAELDELLENIDIGGPTMLRAAAKNHDAVAALSDPADYPALLAELDDNEGALSRDTRARLMRKAFAHTAEYDRVIANTLEERAGEQTAVRLSFGDPQPLRYGENPHQGALFMARDLDRSGPAPFEVLAGKAISFNNLVDLNAAAEAVAALPPSGCAIIKHTNPCGLAVAKSPGAALALAWEGDPLSAFGSIIAFNTPVARGDLELLSLDSEDKGARRFVEVVLAPEFSAEALDYLKLHDSLRVVRAAPRDLVAEREYRFTAGGLLCQQPDQHLYDQLEVVTKRAPKKMDEELVAFGIQAVRALKSNAVCIVRRTTGDAMQLLGMGAGQPNRVTSTGLALAKARENLARETGAQGQALDRELARTLAEAVVASDAFFPFADNVELLAEEGAKLLVQPGGSVRDRAVKKMCNQLDVSMVFTGTRHFKH